MGDIGLQDTNLGPVRRWALWFRPETMGSSPLSMSEKLQGGEKWADVIE